MNVNSLAHTKWEWLGSLCRRKGIEIIEAECCPDHIHMLVRIPPKYSVSEIVGYLKGKSSLIDIGFACAYGNNGKFHRIERRTLWSLKYQGGQHLRLHIVKIDTPGWLIMDGYKRR